MVDAARKKVIAEGFQFAKGKGQSKKLLKDDEEPAPNCPKLSQYLRENKGNWGRFARLECWLDSKTKGYQHAALNMKEYKKWDDIKEETQRSRGRSKA